MTKPNRRKILALVEGFKTEVALMENLFGIYLIEAKYEIVSYGTTIHTLYQEMFRDGAEGFDGLDLLQVLKARESDDDKKRIFDEKYTDILLIFDLDPHDPQFNAEHIQLMQEYFYESSDMRKLYLNYPMVEAFYHMNCIPDENYPDRKACLTELQDKTYKTRVQQETLGNDYRKFIKSKNDCSIVILQNLSKALFMVTGQTVKWDDILKSVSSVGPCAVLEQQLQHLKTDGFLYVLCTCVFFILDYDPKLLLHDDEPGVVCRRD